jgi:photoactive yellow protein
MTTTVTDTLFDRATQMAQTGSFVTEDQLRRLPQMSRSELDAQDYGVVKVDDSGTIQLYNRYEANLAGVEPVAAEGKGFFTQIAPCTNNNLFFGSFKKGVQASRLNVLFPYTFTYRMRPTNVKVHMHRDAATRTNWVLVKKQ